MDELLVFPTQDGPDRDEPAARSLAEEISPDDWRLYHLMRELPNEDRARVLAFADLLVSMRRAQAAAVVRAMTARTPESGAPRTE
ncbi:MAG TPA: hypothetical protein VIL01_15265 [Thermomicrobiales bacterium]